MAGTTKRILALLGTTTSLAVASAAPASAQTILLDAITIIASKTQELAIDALAPVSTVRTDQIQQIQANRTSDLFFGVPGVNFQQRGDDPATAINIRGLQDFGRVAVLIDGARQNFQRTGHNADGQFYIDPAMIGGIDVVRGPTSNIYGSGAIGGVVQFRTKDVEDVIAPHQKWGVLSNYEIGSNTFRASTSHFIASRPTDNLDILFGGSFRDNNNYKDGNGTEWQNTGNTNFSGIWKTTFRPADGHEIKTSILHSVFNHLNGVPIPATSTIFDNNVNTTTASARWRYGRPDDNLLNFDVNTYYNRTDVNMLKVAGTASAATGAIGDRRSFVVDTVGFDANNTSRFQTGGLRHAFTYGFDLFHDQVNVTDPNGTGDLFTPNGSRTAGGGFAQLKSNYSSWLELISALRYDRYDLSGGTGGSSGDRLSPKFTVGVTPVQGIQPYVSYAEGYRAPAVTEAFVTGQHPFFGPGSNFIFLPNLALRPEIGKNKEVGLNLKHDNIFQHGDAFRGKVNVYRNDVTDYIDQATVTTGTGACPAGGHPFCIQYQNVQEAQLEGAEFEVNYDAGLWFVGVSGSRVRGINSLNGTPLLKIPADQIATTFGVRMLQGKMLVSVRWAAVSAKDASDIPNSPLITGSPDLPPTGSYNLVNLYLGYAPTPNAIWSLSVDNLLNEQYAPYGQVYPGSGGAGAQIFPSAGTIVKAGLTVKFNNEVGAWQALALR